jgi:hypothetical protein
MNHYTPHIKDKCKLPNRDIGHADKFALYLGDGFSHEVNVYTLSSFEACAAISTTRAIFVKTVRTTAQTTKGQSIFVLD